MEYESLEQFDQFSDQKVSPSMEEVLSVKAAEQFRADHPDYYASNWNWNIIASFLDDQHVPTTRRNLGIAFRYLESKGMMELRPDNAVTTTGLPSDRGITKVASTGTVKLRYDIGNMAERQLAGESPERFDELLGSTLAQREAEDQKNRELAGKPGHRISEAFRTQFRRSLGVHQRSASRTKMTQGNARAIISEQFPTLNPRSQEFSRKVAELINS